MWPKGPINGEADIAAAAYLLAQPARATLLLAVIEDGPLSASELARRADISLSSASDHLGLLVDGGFLVGEKRGRHRYFRLSGDAVADAVEALAVVAPQRPAASLRQATKGELIRYARTCYDHLAGYASVALAQGLEDRLVVVRSNGTYALGPEAESRLAELAIDLSTLARQRRALVRGCVDWSERELHVAGAVGAALMRRLFELGWIRRRPLNRSVEITAAGRRGLLEEFGVELGDADERRELA